MFEIVYNTIVLHNQSQRERERERGKQSLCVRALERLRCVCGKKEREGNGMGVVW